jgi:hypothetical protein
MFPPTPQRLRDALDVAVSLLTLEDGEEARREAEWEGRCPHSRDRRLSAPGGLRRGVTVTCPGAAQRSYSMGAAQRSSLTGPPQRGSRITMGSSRVAIDL